MLVRQPNASQDRPAIASASIVGAMSLSVGLWLAHAAMGHPAPQASEPPSEPPVFAEPPSESEVESEHEGESEHEVPEPEVVHATPGASAATPPLPSTPRPPPPTGTGTATHVRHGRVAYLRCDGAPQASGPFPCPRDAALEAAVCAAVDQSLTCDPPLPPGQADLVIEFDRSAGATAPTIATRDTFADDAIRTNAAGVVACLTPTLSALTTTIPGDRIRVGFRFALD